MRPAVELCELNRIGDRVWPGKPQATEPQLIANQVTTVAVHSRPDFVNGYFPLFGMCRGVRPGCDKFRFALNAATAFDVSYRLQVANFELLFNLAPNGLD